MNTMELLPEFANDRIATKRIFGLANILNGYRGPIDVSEYENNPEYCLTKLAVNAVAGRPVVGTMSDSAYYRFSLPAHSRDFTPRHPRQPSDFKGIIKRLVNINVPKGRGNEAGKRYCLQVAPLRKGAGPEWKEYYMDHGWEAQFRHPFANPDPRKADWSVWIPLDTLGEYLTYFPDNADASRNATVRSPFWTEIDWDSI